MKSTVLIDMFEDVEPVDVETVAKSLAEDSKDADDGVDKGKKLKSIEFDSTHSKPESKSSKKGKKFYIKKVCVKKAK